MIYRPFTIDREVLLDAIHQLTEGPAGLVVRMGLTAPGEPRTSVPIRILQASLREDVVHFDIVDGADLQAIMARRPRRPSG